MDWLLTRALGPPHARLGSQPITDFGEFGSVIGAARLLNRVGTRIPRQILESDLSASLCAEVEKTTHQLVASELLHEEVARDFAGLAHQQGDPVIFLKGMALRLGGHSVTGSRAASDIDVLLQPEDARAVSDTLELEGWRALDLQPQEQHLAPLVHPLGVVVEIHQMLSGIRIAGHGFATAADCIRAGSCRQLMDWPVGSFVPGVNLLIAYLLVHALRQHGLQPDGYPALQVLGDLQDLGFSGENGERFLSASYKWVDGELSREEVLAVRDILLALEKGEKASTLLLEDSRAALLLRHILAGAMDEDYRQSLKLTKLLNPVSQSGLFVGVSRGLGRALWLTRGQIDVIYGPPKTEVGYLARRLWRPFDLIARTVRTMLAWIRVRFREKKINL